MKSAGLETISSLRILPRSLVTVEGTELGLERQDSGYRLVILAPDGSPFFEGFEGEVSHQNGQSLLIGPANVPQCLCLTVPIAVAQAEAVRASDFGWSWRPARVSHAWPRAGSAGRRW